MKNMNKCLKKPPKFYLNNNIANNACKFIIIDDNIIN